MTNGQLTAELVRMERTENVLKQEQLTRIAGDKRMVMLMDEPSAFGDGDLGWEQQEVLIEFRKERRKIKRSANLILKEMRRRGLLPAIGGEAVRKQLYQDLGADTHIQEWPQDMKDIAMLVAAPELAVGSRFRSAETWLGGNEEPPSKESPPNDCGNEEPPEMPQRKKRPSEPAVGGSSTSRQPATGSNAIRIGRPPDFLPGRSNAATGGSSSSSSRTPTIGGSNTVGFDAAASQVPIGLTPERWRRILFRRTVDQVVEQLHS